MMNDILMVGLLYIAVLVEIIILGEINLLSHYYLLVGVFSIYIIYNIYNMYSIFVFIYEYIERCKLDITLVVYSILSIHTTMPL